MTAPPRPTSERPARGMRRAMTTAIWIVSILSLAIAGLIVAEFIFMATAMDPTEMITAGTEPWTNAGIAVAALAGLVAMTVLSLGLWHTARFKPLAALMTLAQFGGVAWACAKVYTEYF